MRGVPRKLTRRIGRVGPPSGGLRAADALGGGDRGRLVIGVQNVRVSRRAGAISASGERMEIPLDPEILHGGVASVDLPEAPPAQCWRVDWRVIGTDLWHIAAWDLDGGEHLVPDTATPEPQHRIEWRAVAEARAAEPRCTACGARPAIPQGYQHPDHGPVAVCLAHRDCELDWT